MGNQNAKPHTFQQYYDALNNPNPNPTSAYESQGSQGAQGAQGAQENLNLQDIDPYEVFGLSKQFTWDELKSSYHRVAKVVHPDKGGNELLFNMVTDCFRKLAKEYQARQDERQHHELKMDSRKYHDKHEDMRSQDRAVPDSRFAGKDNESFQDRFNRVFSEHQVENDEVQRGYGHLMTESSKTREDISVPQVLKKFSSDAFNAEFNKLPVSKQQQVSKYREPEALVISKNISYTEIGGAGDNFTHSDPAAKKGLFYTDYMEAHTTTRLVDPSKVKKKEFRSVEEYDAYRVQQTQRPLSEREIQAQNRHKSQDERKEQARLDRIRMEDSRALEHYQKQERIQRQLQM